MVVQVVKHAPVAVSQEHHRKGHQIVSDQVATDFFNGGMVDLDGTHARPFQARNDKEVLDVSLATEDNDKVVMRDVVFSSVTLLNTFQPFDPGHRQFLGGWHFGSISIVCPFNVVQAEPLSQPGGPRKRRLRCSCHRRWHGGCICHFDWCFVIKIDELVGEWARGFLDHEHGIFHMAGLHGDGFENVNGLGIHRRWFRVI